VQVIGHGQYNYFHILLSAGVNICDLTSSTVVGLRKNGCHKSAKRRNSDEADVLSVVEMRRTRHEQLNANVFQDLAAMFQDRRRAWEGRPTARSAGWRRGLCWRDRRAEARLQCLNRRRVVLLEVRVAVAVSVAIASALLG
jgi:hypothetical protein